MPGLAFTLPFSSLLMSTNVSCSVSLSLVVCLVKLLHRLLLSLSLPLSPKCSSLQSVFLFVVLDHLPPCPLHRLHAPSALHSPSLHWSLLSLQQNSRARICFLPVRLNLVLMPPSSYLAVLLCAPTCPISKLLLYIPP